MRRFSAGAPAASIAFLLYLIASVILVGHGVLAHFGSRTVGYGPDPSLFIWDLKWWPQSILSGLDPLHAAVVYAPEGFDTALATSIAAPSLLLAPLTQAVGPLPAYNVLVILIPALNGLAAYLLCREASRVFWPALAGGYLFGFSTYVLGQSLGHPNLSLVACPPLIAYLALRRGRGSIGTTAFVACLVALLSFQFLTSSEVFMTMTLMGAATYGLALLLFPAERPAILGLARPILIAYLLTAVLVSPVLVSLLTTNLNLTHIDPYVYSTDPLNLVVPTRISLGGASLAGVGDRLTGNLAESGAYLGVPLLLVLLLFGWQRRRDRLARLLLAAFAVALLAALGPRLNVLGTSTALRLPWTVLLHLPLVRYALPDRVIVYAWLALAVIVSLWLATPTRWRAAKWALVAVALVSVLPNPRATDPSPPHYGSGIWASARAQPAFFASGARPLFRGRPNLLVLPYNEAGEAINLVWQASTGMAYEMPGGYLSGTVPDAFACWPIVGQLRAEVYRRVDRRELLRFLAAKGVEGVVAPTAVAPRAAPLLDVLPGPPEVRQGVVIYRVPAPAQPVDTGCPAPGEPAP